MPANTTRFIDLQGRIASAGLPASVSYAGIELEYDALPGSVIIQLQSISQNGEHVFQVPIFDPQKTPTSAGGYPWKADGDFHTLLYIKNETDQVKRYTAFLTYEGGVYSLGVKEIKGHQTIAVDFRERRDKQTPDVNGNVIPVNLDGGQISWSVKGADNKTLSGRSEQISISLGVASTYDCRNCCPNSFYEGWLNPFDFYDVIGSSTLFIANETEINCYGHIFGPYQPWAINWNITDWGVAYIGYNGMTTAVGTGTAFVQGTWDTGIWWYDINEFCDYIPMQANEEAPVEVVQPTVSSISASVLSTKNPVTNVRPAAGTFTTSNVSTSFATGTSPSDAA